jgi:predicted N-acetyltransferase YhbS
MLGPIAVDPSCRRLGVGAALMSHALSAAKARGHGAVILLGDAAYYERFGFSVLKTGNLSLPGPFERERLLGLELRDGALDDACGLIVPTGPMAPVHQNNLNRHPEVAALLRGPRRMAASTARC